MRVLIVVLVASLACAICAEELFEFLILHNNDMHSRFEETSRNSGTCKTLTSKTRKVSGGCVGGFARTAHEVQRYRKLAQEGRGRPVIFLNAGDTYAGTTWFSVHKYRICSEFLNALMPDVMSLGNHEFDLGVQGLIPFVKASNVPIVAANLDFSKVPGLQTIEKSHILEIEGTKVGVIGHLTEETKLISQPAPVEFLNVVDAIKKESERLDKLGIKIIIALGHSGYEVDKEIAANVPLVDIVVGGHTNTFLFNGLQPDQEEIVDLYPKVIVQESGKKVPVVQAYAYTKYLGRLNVTFNTKGDLVHFEGQPELLDTAIPQDPEMLNLLDKFRPEIAALDKKVIGTSRVILDMSQNKCRLRECNFGNLIADSMVFYMSTLSLGDGWNDVPIGLINGGDIRNTIDPFRLDGNITRGELLGALPFESRLIAFKIKGSDLIGVLEQGARNNGTGVTSRGEFLQVSGLHYVVDWTKPVGERVIYAEARCGTCKIPKYEKIRPDDVYDAVTNSFLMLGGDGHTILQERSFDKREQDPIDVDVLDYYISQQSPVYPEEQGRIRIVQETVYPISEPTNSSAYFNNVKGRYLPLVTLLVMLKYLFSSLF